MGRDDGFCGRAALGREGAGHQSYIIMTCIYGRVPIYSLYMNVVAASGYASRFASGVCIGGVHRDVHQRCTPGKCASMCASPRDHCIVVCIRHESGTHRGSHQVITLSVELGAGAWAHAQLHVD